MPAPGGKGRRWALGIVVALTAAHGGYRWYAHGRRAGVPVSELPLGTRLGALAVQQAGPDGWAPSELLRGATCQIVVAFDPSCPHCLSAARQEAAADPAARLPTTWVAPGDSLGAARYRALVGAGTRVTRSDDAWEELGVRAVPGAFLVDGEGRVRQVWRYRGTETRADLEEVCGRMPDAPGTGTGGGR